MNTVTAEVEILFPEGSRTIEMILKNRYDIEDCEEGKIVVITLVNEDQITGIFSGMSDDDAIIKALDSTVKVQLGYKIQWIQHYFEEIKK